MEFLSAWNRGYGTGAVYTFSFGLGATREVKRMGAHLMLNSQSVSYAESLDIIAYFLLIYYRFKDWAKFREFNAYIKTRNARYGQC